MQNTDDWGADAQVRYLRRGFAAIETSQKAFLDDLDLRPFDERLRRARESALHLFERAWMHATRNGITLSEDDFGVLYVSCLATLLKSRGVDIPPGAVRAEKKIEGILAEVAK